MKKRRKIRVISYGTAAVLALALYAWAGNAALKGTRLAAAYSAGRAFEETVQAVDALSAELQKSLYATDGSMCSRICGEACAQARAAGAALSTLPFATQELEQISAFLNVAGDYAYTLCGQAARAGFSPEQRTVLSDMSDRASQLRDTLIQLRGALHEGTLHMDSREKKLPNVLPADSTETLSRKLLAYEADFPPLAALAYDGQYGASEEKRSQGYLTEEEMQRAAAEFLETEPEALKELCSYQGLDGRRCYRWEDSFVCVSRSGVESMSCSRLTGETRISPEETQARAEQFLQKRGYENLVLSAQEEQGNRTVFSFARTENGAVCLDDTVTVSVARDDGSVCGFDASSFSDEDTGAVWSVGEEQAAEKLPDNLRREESRKVILKSPGRRDLACYEFRCTDDAGRSVLIYVDADSGEQCRIRIV